MPRRLLTRDDPAPFEVLRPDGTAGLVLFCDHAGARVPAALHQLGLMPESFGQHIAIDIGADQVTRQLSRRLNATAVLATYSRLVIDCNRWLDDPRLILPLADGTPVPGNEGLSDDDRQRRIDEMYWPYHKALCEIIDRAIDRFRSPLIVSIHSFTPVLGDERRPWHVGTFWHRDSRLSDIVVGKLRAEEGLVVGDNQPYSAQIGSFSIDYHGWSEGLPHVGVEIRQDQLADQSGIDRFTNLLGDALAVALEKLR